MHTWACIVNTIIVISIPDWGASSSWLPVGKMILASIFVCFCIASAVNYLRIRRQRGLVVNLKGPFTWPLVGGMHKIVLLTQKSTFSICKWYWEWWLSFGRFLPAQHEVPQQVWSTESLLGLSQTLHTCRRSGTGKATAAEWNPSGDRLRTDGELAGREC